MWQIQKDGGPATINWTLLFVVALNVVAGSLLVARVWFEWRKRHAKETK